jgi:hypothetical protein
MVTILNQQKREEVKKRHVVIHDTFSLQNESQHRYAGCEIIRYYARHIESYNPSGQKTEHPSGLFART